jgi:hypothetical protein
MTKLPHVDGLKITNLFLTVLDAGNFTINVPADSALEK